MIISNYVCSLRRCMPFSKRVLLQRSMIMQSLRSMGAWITFETFGALENESGTPRVDQTLSIAADHTQYMANYSDSMHDSSLVKLKSSLQQALIAASAFLSKKQVATVDAFLQVPSTGVITAQVSGNRHTSFLQGPSFTGTYSAQSGEVVGISKDMRKSFQAELTAAVDTEAKAETAHALFIKNQGGCSRHYG